MLHFQPDESPLRPRNDSSPTYRNSCGDFQKDRDGHKYITFLLPEDKDRTRKWIHWNFLILKLIILETEWARRHAFFVTVGNNEYSAANKCHKGCYLFEATGTHDKTVIEEEWEELAANTHRSYIALLRRLAELDEEGHLLTGYSFKNDPNFGPDAIPFSLFDMPYVPGPSLPPGDSIDYRVTQTNPTPIFDSSSRFYGAMLKCRRVIPAPQVPPDQVSIPRMILSQLAEFLVGQPPKLPNYSDGPVKIQGRVKVDKVL